MEKECQSQPNISKFLITTARPSKATWDNERSEYDPTSDSILFVPDNLTNQCLKRESGEPKGKGGI